MYDRKQLVELLKPWATTHKDILAAWEGGSAATNRLDQYSDLDLSLIVSDDQVEVVFADLDAFLSQHFNIIRKHRVPEPAWHGLSQCFYQIDDVTPFVYLDIAVIKESIPDKLMEQDRHGLANIWFDHKGIYDPRPQSKEAIDKRGKGMFQSVVATDFLIILEVQKGIERGYFIDVFPTYATFVLRHLGVMLNLKYRPERVDFGLRYGRFDYDDIDHQLIEKAFKVSTIEDMRIAFVQILKRYEALKQELAPIWSKAL